MMLLLKKYEQLIEELDLTDDKKEEVKHIFQEFMNNYFDYSKAYNEVVLNNATLFNEKEIVVRENEKLIKEIKKLTIENESFKTTISDYEEQIKIDWDNIKGVDEL
jgi:hypothetical protein